MRILILTQPIGHNYGGIIQAYALQRFLYGLGHEVQTLDYRRDKRRHSLKKLLRSPRTSLRELRKESAATTHRKIPRDFIERRIFLTKTYYPILRPSHIRAHLFDCFIVGSDQCWRPKYSPHLPTFFLDFVEWRPGIKRIVYGASFGTDEWELSDEMTALARQNLKRFDFLSVRESSAVDLCKNHLGLIVSQVVDPTLLLDRDHYTRLIREEEAIHRTGEDRRPRIQEGSNPTLLTYFLDPSEAIENLAAQVCRTLNLEWFDFLSTKNHGQELPSVGEWLRSFYEAEYILTDSFHGLVFSLMFQKQFVVIENTARGGARFRSLLDALHLSDRVISTAELSGKRASEILSQGIDWLHVERLLADQRHRSRERLRTALKTGTTRRSSTNVVVRFLMRLGKPFQGTGAGDR